jgi:hypothetical protein
MVTKEEKALSVVTTRQEAQDWFLGSLKGSVMCRSGELQQECFTYAAALRFFNTVEGKNAD